MIVRPKPIVTGYYIEDPNGDVRDTLFIADRTEAHAQARQLAAVTGRTVRVRVCREAPPAASEAPPEPPESDRWEVTVPLVVLIERTPQGWLQAVGAPRIEHGFPGFHGEAETAFGVWDIETEMWGHDEDEEAIADVAYNVTKRLLDLGAEASQTEEDEDDGAVYDEWEPDQSRLSPYYTGITPGV